MRANRPELRVITVTILLGTLALALTLIIGYAWWSSQYDLTHHTEEKVDIIAQFLENGMALLPQEGADLSGLQVLMAQVGEATGAHQLQVARGGAVARQYGPSDASYVPDDRTHQAFQTGDDITVVETVNGRRIVRRLKALEASPNCTGCHEAAPGEILGVMDVSFDLARIQTVDPGFYRNLLLVSLLVSVILVLLVFLVFSRVNMARRIESVAGLAGDIAAGDLERRVSALPGTGMDGLARSINEMAESLQAHEDALARQQRELEEANRRLEVLVQESHHRIKNNLQTVADLLSLQAVDCPAAGAPPVGGGSCLKDSIQRVKSIAAVHELLSVEQAESTNVQELAERLLATSVQNVAAPGQQIVCSVTGDGLHLASKEATALALALNELFNNALVHGLADRGEGQISVNIQQGDDLACLNVRDDGVGLPPDFAWETHERLGLRIVHTLVQRELKGELVLHNGDRGTEVHICIPNRGDAAE